MIELLFIAIGLSFALFFTLKFLLALTEEKGSFKSKVWTWLKNLYHAIDGMG